MSRKSSTTTEPNHAQIARQLEKLFASDRLSAGQYNILSDCLLDLSNASGVWMDHPEIVRVFYTVAARYKAELEIRDELRGILDAIERGEKFEDYQSMEGLQVYRQRQRCAELAKDKTVSAQTRRKLRAALAATDTLPNFGKLIELAEQSREKRQTNG